MKTPNGTGVPPGLGRHSNFPADSSKTASSKSKIIHLDSVYFQRQKKWNRCSQRPVSCPKRGGADLPSPWPPPQSIARYCYPGDEFFCRSAAILAAEVDDCKAMLIRAKRPIVHWKIKSAKTAQTKQFWAAWLNSRLFFIKYFNFDC